MKVILAEKPSVAKEIAKILNVNKRADGYIYNESYSITWAYGHLVSLETDKAYGYEKWDIDNLQIFPEEFKLRLGKDTGVKKQFKIIEKLFSKADEIINATDAGREGELIFRYIYEYCNSRKSNNLKRLWISDITEETIRKGLNELKKGEDYNNLYLSAKARSEADWLIGINFTQCVTLSSNKGQVLSIGRVQTATLKLIAERYISNVKHEKIPYYVPLIKVDAKGEEVVLRSKENFSDEKKATRILELIKDKIKVKVEEKKTDDKPPLLFDLTELQKKANTKFKLSAKKTLQVCQDLYEKHKALSYPRTDSQYLSTNQAKEIPILLENINNVFVDEKIKTLTNEALINIENNKVFNNSKLTDHHAIIPTNLCVDLSNFNKEEIIIYRLVVERFLSCFMNTCKKQVRSYKVVLNEILFSNSSTIVLEKGWYRSNEFFNKEKEEKIYHLPKIESGEELSVIGVSVEEQHTKPLPIFTESTLLNEMQKVGKSIEDKDLKEAIKSCGLGTPATRADTIENLVRKTYIEKSKGKLIPTKIGLELIVCLRGTKISSPELTAEYEFKLDLISKGEFTYSEFMKETKSYIEELLPQLKVAGRKLSKIQTKKEANQTIIGSCPKCKKGKIKVSKNAYYCEFYPKKECDFVFRNKIAGAKLPESQAKLLIELKETKLIKGMLSSDKKPFDAKLKLDEAFQIKFVFNKNSSTDKKEIMPKRKKTRTKKRGI